LYLVWLAKEEFHVCHGQPTVEMTTTGCWPY